MQPQILVGSCSWTDPSLIAGGRFYPPGVTSAEARLRYYAEQFPIVEVDSTYYSLPSRRNSELWAERTPDGFVFNVKAHALLTGHPARVDRLPGWLRGQLEASLLAKKNLYRTSLDEPTVERLWEIHREALEPLVGAGKVGAALFQFPPWFMRSDEHAAYVRGLPAHLPGLRLAVEFRGGGWMDDDAAASTLRLLEAAGLAYVSVDEPQGFRSSTPPVLETTSDLAILRLHGRNVATWEARTGAASDRFKYLYSDEELEEWAPKVRELAQQAGTVHVLFNNNYQDWGMRNAHRMAQLLGVEPQTAAKPPAPQTRLDLS